MQKKLLFFLPLLAVITLFLYQKSRQKHLPPPTETIVKEGEEDSDGQMQRKAWIESMHRSAPGDNWRAAELATQQARAAERTKRRGAAAARTGCSADTIVTDVFSGVWTEKGSTNQAGSVFDTEYDPATDKIWLISAGGTLWRGARDGSQWEVINQDYQFSDGMLQFLPRANGRRLLAAIGHTPHYSDDEGETWTAATGIEIVGGWGRIKQPVFVNDTTLYLLSKSDYWEDWRIYKSTDAGESYTATTAYLGNDDGESRVAMCQPYGLNDIYTLDYFGNTLRMKRLNVATEEVTTVGTSTDFSTGNRVQLVGSATATDTIFYTYNSENGDVARSTDFGNTWTTQGTIPAVPWDVGIFLSPYDGDILYAGSVEAQYSLDAGVTWTTVNGWGDYYANPAGNLHADMMAFDAFTTAAGEQFSLSSNHGGLYVTYDDFNTVENIGLQGLNVGQFYSAKSGDSDPGIIIGGTQDQGLQRGIDDFSGAPFDFDQVISGDYGHVEFTNGGNSFWTVYPGGWVTHYQNTFSGGITQSFDLAQNGDVWLTPLQTSRIAGENSIYVAGGNMSADGGSYLVKAEVTASGSLLTDEIPYNFKDFANGASLSAVEVSPLDPQRIYTSTTNGRFFYSTDGGANWEQNVNFLLNGHYLYGQSIYASKTDENTVYLAGSGYSNPGVYRSTDNGQFFSDFSEGLPPTLVFEITANADESLLFAATEAGPYVYIAAEERWFDMSGICAPVQTYWSVQYIEGFNLVRFGTYGRGIWDFVIEQELPSSADNFAQADNFKVYPNPAHSFVTAELPEVPVTLYLTNTIGKRVKSFKISEKKARLSLEGVPAGTYFLHGKKEDKKYVRQLVVTR